MEIKCIGFIQAIEELKLNSKVVYSVISDKRFKCFLKYEYKPKKLQFPITTKVVFDLETYNKDRAVPYCKCIFTLRKIAGKYNRHITEKEYQKTFNDCVVSKGSVCIIEMLDHILSFKGEVKKVTKIVLNIIYT